MKAKLKVSRAVTKAAFSHPFYGSCMLSLNIHQDDSIPTACTNGQFIKWNEEFIDEQSEEQTLGLMAHEVMHVILQHCEDHGPQFDDPKMCNIAMDIAINHTLTDAGFALPEGGVPLEDRFRNMNWKAIYKIIENEEEYKEMAKELTLEDVLTNSDLSDAEKEELKQKIEQMTIQAAQNAGPGNVPGQIEELIKKIRTSSVDWREYITATFQSLYPEDYTMRRPNRKWLGAEDMYLPTMEGTKAGNIVVHLDTSASVSTEEKEQFLGELNEISQQFQPESVMIFYTDYEVANVQTFGAGEEITELESAGGGGTSFVPTFKYIADNNIEVDQMLVFSDMEVWDSCFPDEAPDYPVLFISTRDHYDVPFGECVTTGGK